MTSKLDNPRVRWFVLLSPIVALILVLILLIADAISARGGTIALRLLVAATIVVYIAVRPHIPKRRTTRK